MKVNISKEEEIELTEREEKIYAEGEEYGMYKGIFIGAAIMAILVAILMSK